MSTFISSLLVVKDGVGDRLRAARTMLGLKQPELASIGGISRATQVNYENGQTAPTTDYLKAIHPSKVDLSFVLFDQTKEQLDRIENSRGSIDWARLRQAHEDVEFFCLKFAPQCPSSYRWKMVSDLYSALDTNGEEKLQQEAGVPGTLELIGNMWTAYDKA